MSLIWATYLGGSGNGFEGAGDDALAIAVDAYGEPCVAGYTYSTDFPLAKAFQTTCKACNNGEGDHDAFVSILSADGSQLPYSTYLGGSGPIRPWASPPRSSSPSAPGSSHSDPKMKNSSKIKSLFKKTWKLG